MASLFASGARIFPSPLGPKLTRQSPRLRRASGPGALLLVLHAVSSTVLRAFAHFHRLPHSQVVPVSKSFNDYAVVVQQKLQAAGFFADVGPRHRAPPLAAS